MDSEGASRPQGTGQAADLIVVGSGVAGLSAALAAAEAGARVTLLTGGALLSGSSPWAQGGIAAAVGADDRPALHEADTLAVGGALNDARAVGVLVRDGRRVARALLAAGVPFDGGPDAPDLGLEAGHGRRRILHAGGGATGRAVTSALLAQVVEHPLVRVHAQTPVDDLLVERGRAAGVRSGAAVYRGRAVLLATGGYAALWARTTNRPENRGSGIALAWRAGASLADLEFVQFHPTALVLPAPADGRPSAYLLTEALRGDGARLVDADECPVVDPLLARDVVARAVARHRRDRGPVYLSLRHLDPAFVRGRFPAIAAALDGWGLDLARDLLPIAPAAHYCMGGVRTDLAGRTDLPGLYVAGEAACTGAQGANRLASNSLLECLVFGRRAALAALSDPPTARARWRTRPLPHDGFPAGERGARNAERGTGDERGTRSAERGTRNGSSPSALGLPPSALRPPSPALGDLLERDLGVERDAAGLLDLLAALPAPAAEAGDALLAALAARAAFLRRESRGAHHRTDAPATDPAWRGRIHWRRDLTPHFEEVSA